MYYCTLQLSAQNEGCGMNRISNGSQQNVVLKSDVPQNEMRCSHRSGPHDLTHTVPPSNVCNFLVQLCTASGINVMDAMSK